MRQLITLCCIVVSTFVSGQSVDTNELLGTWKIDLRPTPDAEPYFQEMVISKISKDGKKFEGSFYYESKIIHSAINKDWGKLVIAFVTEDNSGFYNSTAVLEDGVLKGTTHSIGREFVAVWTAVKQP